jgi:phosphoglycolate phosphatase
MHDLQALNGATIAFDLDGTLVDTAPDLVGALNMILAEEGLPPLPFDEVRLMVGAAPGPCWSAVSPPPAIRWTP